MKNLSGLSTIAAVGAIFFAHCVIGALAYRELPLISESLNAGRVRIIEPFNGAFIFTPLLFAIFAYGSVLYFSSLLTSRSTTFRIIASACISLAVACISTLCYLTFCFNMYGS